MKKIVIIIFFVIIGITSCSKEKEAAPASAPSTPLISTPTRLTFTGVGVAGIFDLSISKKSSESTLWMSYSAVDAAPTYWGLINYHTISTRIAYSNDSGKNWYDLGNVTSTATDVILGDGVEPWEDDAGTWVNEVSKIVYDPKADNWKLFWHHYLMINQLGDPTGYRKFQHGWIGLKVANTPNDLAAATEVKLFGANAYDIVNNTQDNATTKSVLGGAPIVMLNTLHADLSDCVAFSEPGAYATSSSLYLTIFCYEASGNNRLALLKCNGSCDAANWSYIRTIFENTDAVNMGYEKFSASELFSHGGVIYLMISPVTNYPFNNSYSGCLIFKFTDIDTGILDGPPTVYKSIFGNTDKFNGACGYHESATSSGFIYGEVFEGESDMYRLFYSNKTL